MASQSDTWFTLIGSIGIAAVTIILIVAMLIVGFKGKSKKTKE